ncbi:hypothetical protein XI07_13750 [Bradyrhizobium sp. CCBAU 11445]|nr:hypothetical protein [Bradyrhizobium sp. CCBAU 11445]
MSAKHNEVCVVNVEGPFQPTPDTPAVKLVKASTGNLVCKPVGLEGSMFGGAFVYTGDSRFGDAVRELSGYDHGFPVALHDRVELSVQWPRDYRYCAAPPRSASAGSTRASASARPMS